MPLAAPAGTMAESSWRLTALARGLTPGSCPRAGNSGAWAPPLNDMHAVAHESVSSCCMAASLDNHKTTYLTKLACNRLRQLPGIQEGSVKAHESGTQARWC